MGRRRLRAAVHARADVRRGRWLRKELKVLGLRVLTTEHHRGNGLQLLFHKRCKILASALEVLQLLQCRRKAHVVEIYLVLRQIT
jgi:hypothetical protein